jgi:FAD/FMN-containing dehydrogenase
MTSSLSPDLLHALGSRFRGDLIAPDSDSYEPARKVWNGMIDKRPAAILRCKSIADVQSAVRFARENAVPLAIRGGGHNVAGHATCDDGVVLDLSGMRDVVVDAHVAPPRSTGSPRPAAPSRPPASPVSHSAADSVGSCAATA